MSERLPEALIFDVDGTLAETEELHRRAFNEAFAELGLDWCWSRDDYKRLLKTTGGKERIAVHMAAIGTDPASIDIAALHGAKTARCTALMAAGEIALRPGVQALMDRARADGLRLAIATTTGRPNVEALALGIWGMAAEAVFDVIACGDEVAAKKPAPDIYALALSRLDLTPARAIAFEDSRNGLLSALAAGLGVIITPSAYTEDEDFAGALQVLPDLAGLGGVNRLLAKTKDQLMTSTHNHAPPTTIGRTTDFVIGHTTIQIECSDGPACRLAPRDIP